MEILNLKPSLARKLNQDGLSPIHLALAKGLVDMVQHFLAFDKDLARVKGRDGCTALHYATKQGSLLLLANILMACPECIGDVTTRNETALHIAVHSRRLDALDILTKTVEWPHRTFRDNSKVLIFRILNKKNNYGNTALHLAALSNQPQMVKLLSECNKVDKNAINECGLTALDLLIQTSKSVDNKECMEILHRAGGSQASWIDQDPPLDVQLRSKVTFREKIFGKAFHDILQISIERSNVLLVVLVLILTATYQATLSPPGSFWLVDSGEPGGTTSTRTTTTVATPPISSELKSEDHRTSQFGKSLMSTTSFFLFFIPNIMAFLLTTVLTLGLLLSIISSGITNLLQIPFLLLYFCLLSSTYYISPTPLCTFIFFSFNVALLALCVMPTLKWFYKKERKK